MKKAGIITIQSIVNYGNRLQNYAVEQMLKSRNIEVESVRISEPILWTKIYIKAYLECFWGNGKIHQNKGKRTKNFLKFNKRYLNIKVIKSKNAKRYFHQYDFLVLGGDQLWAQGNKDYGIDGYRFGSLVEAKKRIPFGVSFGSENVSEEYGKKITPWLKQLKYLAIREKSGADIIEKLIGRSARVFLDPVFGLSVEEWNRLSENNNYQQEKYGCSLFLGECKKKIRDQIAEIMKDKKVIEINDYRNECSCVGPEIFVNMIKNAEIVFTDSFHCVAFAIIYNKPFVVFERENWDRGQITRLKNMLEIFHLEDRLYSGKELDWFKIDYDEVNCTVEKERKRMNQYLDEITRR